MYIVSTCIPYRQCLLKLHLACTTILLASSSSYGDVQSGSALNLSAHTDLLISVFKAMASISRLSLTAVPVPPSSSNGKGPLLMHGQQGRTGTGTGTGTVIGAAGAGDAAAVASDDVYVPLEHIAWMAKRSSIDLNALYRINRLAPLIQDIQVIQQQQQQPQQAQQAFACALLSSSSLLEWCVENVIICAGYYITFILFRYFSSESMSHSSYLNSM